MSAMNTSPRQLVFLLFAVTCLVLAGGCQTTKGFGQDVEKLGDKIQKKAS